MLNPNRSIPVSGIGRPIFDAGLFSFKGRRDRLSFFLVGLTIFIVSVFVLSFAALPAPSGGGDGWILLFSAFALLAAWINLSTITQRLRDIGLSPWWTIGVVVSYLAPFVGLVISFLLLLLPGTKGPNIHGPSPLGETGVIQDSEPE